MTITAYENHDVGISDRLNWDEYAIEQTRALQTAPLPELLREAYLALKSDLVGNDPKATAIVEEVLYRAEALPSTHFENHARTRRKVVVNTSDFAIGMSIVHLAEQHGYSCFFRDHVQTPQ